ncbi:MAG: DUF4230 domain-containing protein [Paludibacteraceae bacterium]|nr:DUF4230 domain-containing protein [Paludibacteraceae bacterium]
MLKSIKAILICVLLIIIFAVFAYLQIRYDILGLGKSEDELRIEKTALAIEETKKISEFTAIHFSEDVVVKKERVDKGKIFNSKNEMVLIAHGKVRAGVNLADIKEEEYFSHGDTLSLKLPQAQIFDIIINPSNYEIFVEDGKWSHEEVTAALVDAKKHIEEDALKSGIIEKAKKSSIEKLTELYKALGFNTVEIQ